MNKTRSSAVMFFRRQWDRNGSKMKLLKNNNNNVATLSCKKSRFWHIKFNFKRKLLFSKLISTCPEEHLKHFFVNWFFSDFEQKIFGRVVKTAFYVTRGNIFSEFFF